jgi:ankyrin repeat protein
MIPHLGGVPRVTWRSCAALCSKTGCCCMPMIEITHHSQRLRAGVVKRWCAWCVPARVGAQLNLRDPRGHSALGWACTNGRPNILSIPLAEGADAAAAEENHGLR